METTIEERLQRLEEGLRRVEDREKIRELCATYCFLVDDEKFDDLVGRCFTDDACCDFRAVDGSIPPIIARGRAEVRLFFTQTVPGALRNMSHTVHNHRIKIEGDLASGDCYFELTATDIASGEDVMGAGRYLDRYRRVDGSWRFEQRDARIFFIAPLSEGWSSRRFVSSSVDSTPAPGNRT